MHSKQRGMTFIGVLILFSVLGALGFGIIQLIPIYLENMKVVQTLNRVKTDMDNNKPDVAGIRKAIRMQMVVEDLREIDVKTDFVISRTDSGYKVTADYERRRPYLANIYLLVDFENSVEILR